jgi:chemotaxis protein MotB
MLVSLSDVVAEEKYLAILNALHQHLGYETAPHTPPGKNFPLNSLMTTLESLGSYSNEEMGFGGVKQKGVEGDDLKVFTTREGESRTAGRPIFYKPFKVDIPAEELPTLTAIAAELVGKPNKVVVRAYASPKPLPEGSPYADKISLTYARGHKVFRFLVAQGVDYKRLRIDAMSDTEPLSHSGDDDTLQHDRVEVIILNAFADEFVGPAETP